MRYRVTDRVAMTGTKLDYVLDDQGNLSMVIYNSHPPGAFLVAPKYVPTGRGPWQSHASGKRYERFEYFWNVRKRKDGTRGKVYDLDDNPDHDYTIDVEDQANLRLSPDPCHGVDMFTVDEENVAVYFDARTRYQDAIENDPPELRKFHRILSLIEDTLDPREAGITGSYLYDLYQPFSDLNIVVYDAGAMERFKSMLRDHGGLDREKRVSIEIPAVEWGGWFERAWFAKASDSPTTRDVVVKSRFIGSLHDPRDKETRMGFWIANTNDPFLHGTFTSHPAGVALIEAKITHWQEGMPSGCHRIYVKKVLGWSPRTGKEKLPATGGDICKKPQSPDIDVIQVLGEFSRMFLENEVVVAFGLVQETRDLEGKVLETKLLVGGREMGGWILPATVFQEST